MAKRKSGKRKGFKLELAEDYRAEKYVMYIANAESGILQAGTIDPDLTDGDIYKALNNLILRLENPDTFQKFFTPKPADENHTEDQKMEGLVQSFIIMNLRRAFEQYGPLDAKDVIGILGVIRTSVKRWSHGMHRRGYLTYIEGFLGEMGVGAWQLSEEEVENLEFYRVIDQPENGE